MKVAIVHDFLTQMGGAEKVVEVLHGMFPEAPIYTSLYDSDTMPSYYRTWDIRTSFLQRMPAKQKLHRAALLLYPLAFEKFDLSEYSLVISSSSAFAKGVVTHPDALHVCYTHTPMRYAWSSRAYMKNEKASLGAKLLLDPILHYLRLWDQVASSRVDLYVANSSTVANRIRKYYGRDSATVFPPVDTARFHIAPHVEDYYLIASRFIPYKRLDLAIQAFTKMNRRLKVVGEGRHGQALRLGAGPNIEFMGRVDDVALADLMARAKGYVMPGEEDFGIAPVEANACGRPVIAFARGGALDTQIDGVTGVLFREQTVEALCAAVQCAEEIDFDPCVIRTHAEQFSTAVFECKLRQLILEQIAPESSTVILPPRLRERVAP